MVGAALGAGAEAMEGGAAAAAASFARRLRAISTVELEEWRESRKQGERAAGHGRGTHS